ncbi:hypothetical protein [Ligilactobacillus equi]|uniref:hypothetical protein n=1 Tax=Ligilactobacillus equi TaxID=137357 RepID=UPI000468E763|nr:hypothetical protein [Ligilactobacillus equi]
MFPETRHFSDGVVHYIDINAPFVNVYVASRYTETYEQEIEEAQKGHLAYAYVYNVANPVFSEYGSVQVNKNLIRIN